jgi:hypothetical protein
MSDDMNHFSAVWGGLQVFAIRAGGEVMNHFSTVWGGLQVFAIRAVGEVMNHFSTYPLTLR